MFRPSLTEWPIQDLVRGSAPYPRGGVAPLRHDLALADYVEKQARFRDAGTALESGHIVPVEAVARALVWLCRALVEATSRRTGGRVA